MSSLKFSNGGGNIQNGTKLLAKGKTLLTTTTTTAVETTRVVNPYTHDIVKESADFILNHTQHRPKIGIICGSGLGKLP
jgi:hypothetical protein